MQFIEWRDCMEVDDGETLFEHVEESVGPKLVQEIVLSLKKYFELCCRNATDISFKH